MNHPDRGPLSLSPSVREFVDQAAVAANVSEAEVVASLLAHQGIDTWPQFRELEDRLSKTSMEVLLYVDHRLRIANPSTRHVFRSEYIGYRRADVRMPFGEYSSRVDVYASLLPRKGFVHLLVPLDPDDYRDVPAVDDLRAKGHQGVGDTRMTLKTLHDVDDAFDCLRQWLGPVSCLG